MLQLENILNISNTIKKIYKLSENTYLANVDYTTSWVPIVKYRIQFCSNNIYVYFLQSKKTISMVKFGYWKSVQFFFNLT